MNTSHIGVITVVMLAVALSTRCFALLCEVVWEGRFWLVLWLWCVAHCWVLRL
jgi:hypothetical protein